MPLELTGSHQQDPLYPWPPLWMLHLSTLTVTWLFPEGTTPPSPHVVTISTSNIPWTMGIRGGVGVSLLLLFTSRPLSRPLLSLESHKIRLPSTPPHSAKTWVPGSLSLPITTMAMIPGELSIHTDDPVLWLLSLSSTLIPRSDTSFNCNSSRLLSNHHHLLWQFFTSGTPTSVRPTSGTPVRLTSHWSYHFSLSLNLLMSGLNS